MKQLLAHSLASRLQFNSAALARWTQATLVVLLGITLAQLTWQLLPSPATAPAPRLTPAAPAWLPTAPRLEAVAALHLFGTAAPAPVGAQQSNAPATSLNLTLRGLFASTDKAQSFAIIAEGAGEERFYRIGATLGGSATVREILADRVILERAGKYETLRLPTERLALTAASAPARPHPGMRELREKLLHTPQETWQLANVTPVLEGGRIKGYRVQPKQYQDIFHAAGLRPEDVITSVNGIAVTDPAQFAALQQQLSQAEVLSIAVARPDGSSSVIQISLK